MNNIYLTNNNVYYLFPKWLIDINISADAKILYVYLYNLSLISKDDYLYITASEIEKIFNITEFKRKKILRELVSNNLIRRVNRGKNTKTYVLKSDERR